MIIPQFRTVGITMQIVPLHPNSQMHIQNHWHVVKIQPKIIDSKLHIAVLGFQAIMSAEYRNHGFYEVGLEIQWDKLTM